MAPDTAPKTASSRGLSLYANLLDSSSNKESKPGTISRAPVVFKQTAGEESQQDRASTEKQQISAASLRFQPTKRPQLSAQKSKPKASTQKPSTTAPLSAPISLDPIDVAVRPPAKTTLAAWTADGEDNDVNGFYGGEKRQRGGRKKRKKTKEESHVPQNWDDIYDPSRPNNYEEYKNSDEKIIEIREWKDRLYAHRMANRRGSDSDSSDGYNVSQSRKKFAPPAMSFKPPPSFEGDGRPKDNTHEVSIPHDPSDEERYARRARLSGLHSPAAVPEPQMNSHHLEVSLQPPPSQPPPASEVSEAQKPSPPPVVNAPPPPSISRAPVRYSFPVAPPELPATEAELEGALQIDQSEEEALSDAASRSLRPGQKGFAERLMTKYGWSKGSGLGASGSGIVNPLRVQIEKQKKKPDSEGGGFVGPGGRGKIIGGKKKSAESEEGRFGMMSEVIVLRGMVDGMDLDAEMEGSGDGGLMQEIGEECGDKYGRVERVFIDRGDVSKAPVFVKFTSQLSALRAVNALEGRIFNGNTITARFFDTEKFESGVYD